MLDPIITLLISKRILLVKEQANDYGRQTIHETLSWTGSHRVLAIDKKAKRLDKVLKSNQLFWRCKRAGLENKMDWAFYTEAWALEAGRPVQYKGSNMAHMAAGGHYIRSTI